jgi:hypothetical protein
MKTAVTSTVWQWYPKKRNMSQRRVSLMWWMAGAIVHWLRFEGSVTELYDVQVIPEVQRPMALGFQIEEIAQLITWEF